MCDQVVTVQHVDDIDEVHQLDPVHQVDHKDAHHKNHIYDGDDDDGDGS